MRLVVAIAAVAALSFPAYAQPRQPGPPPRQPAPPPQAQQQPAPLPGMFPCRTASEVCFIVVAVSANQAVILFSNAPQAQGAEGRPVAVQGADLGADAGKVVMLTGDFAANSINNAQVVDRAGPLLSFAIKSQMSGDDSQQSAPPPQRGAPPPRR